MKKAFSLAAALVIAISASAATKGKEPVADPSWPVGAGAKYPKFPAEPKYPSWPSVSVASWPID